MTDAPRASACLPPFCPDILSPPCREAGRRDLKEKGFGGSAAANGRGAVMVYSSVGDPRTASWYAELAGSAASDWSPKVMTGITSAEFASLVAPVAAPGRSV
jgi:hypothetical protein